MNVSILRYFLHGRNQNRDHKTEVPAGFRKAPQRVKVGLEETRVTCTDQTLSRKNASSQRNGQNTISGRNENSDPQIFMIIFKEYLIDFLEKH